MANKQPKPFMGIVKPSRLNVRAGKSTSAEVLRIISSGETLELLPAGKDWYKLADHSGFVMSKFINKIEGEINE